MAPVQQTTELTLEDYQSITPIGKGGFGEVFSAVHKPTQAKRAIKYVKDSLEVILKETTILELLNKDDTDHFVVKYYGMHPVTGGHCMVFDLLRGNLASWVYHHHPEGAPLNVVQTIGSRLLGAFQYLGRKGILHGDVKAQNILLQSPDPATLRLCDFGLAKQMGSENSVVPVLFPRNLACLGCRAPEVIIGYGSTYPMSPDMWAVGCVLMSLTFLCHYFKDPDSDKPEDVLIKGCKMLGKPPVHMLRQAKHIKFSSWLRNSNTFPQTSEPLKRMLVEQLHKNGSQDLVLVKKFYSLLCRFFTMDPSARVRPSEALQHPFFHT